MAGRGGEGNFVPLHTVFGCVLSATLVRVDHFLNVTKVWSGKAEDVILCRNVYTATDSTCCV